MQSRQDIHVHGDASDEDAVQSLWRSLAILRGLGYGGQQRGLDEAEIEIDNLLGHTEVRVVRCARMRG